MFPHTAFSTLNLEQAPSLPRKAGSATERQTTLNMMIYATRSPYVSGPSSQRPCLGQTTSRYFLYIIFTATADLRPASPIDLRIQRDTVLSAFTAGVPALPSTTTILFSVNRVHHMIALSVAASTQWFTTTQHFQVELQIWTLVAKFGPTSHRPRQAIAEKRCDAMPRPKPSPTTRRSAGPAKSQRRRPKAGVSGVARRRRLAHMPADFIALAIRKTAGRTAARPHPPATALHP